MILPFRLTFVWCVHILLNEFGWQPCCVKLHYLATLNDDLFTVGGLEAFEEKLQREEEEKEAAKRREEERRAEISKKTRSRLSELLDRKRAEVLQELERYVK